MGDGEILSVKDDTVIPNYFTRYLVKFSFGVGYVRRNAILEVLPSSDSSSSAADSSWVQEEVCTLFGTKNMYILLRLYGVLTTVCKQLATGFNFEALLKLATEKGANEAEYEVKCAELFGRLGCHRSGFSIPFLVKRCADAFSRVAEDGFKLVHLSQLQLKVSCFVIVVELLAFFLRSN